MHKGYFSRACCDDAGLIFTVLRNLLGNAAKYRTGGPVSVTLRRAGEQALLVVDNAIDSSNVLDHEGLFERWERGSATAGKSGMGLGLYLVRRIVHDHADEVSIATVPSDRFIITLKLPLFYGDINGYILIVLISWQSLLAELS